ncbi:hypothetical protein SLE2022_251930 [Rubroshorea leprosula]
MRSSLVKDVEGETVGYLTQAFCHDGKVDKGCDLLQQLWEDGSVPGNIVFNKLIAGHCKKRNFNRVSELFHAMIGIGSMPQIYIHIRKSLMDSVRQERRLRVTGFSMISMTEATI